MLVVMKIPHILLWCPTEDVGGDEDFEVVQCAGITNFDVDGLVCNPSPSDEDLTGAM